MKHTSKHIKIINNKKIKNKIIKNKPNKKKNSCDVNISDFKSSNTYQTLSSSKSNNISDKISSLFEDNLFCSSTNLETKDELNKVFTNSKCIFNFVIYWMEILYKFIYKFISQTIIFIFKIIKSKSNKCSKYNKYPIETIGITESTTNNVSLIDEINLLDTDFSKVKNNFTNGKKSIFKKHNPISSSNSSCSLSSNTTDTSDSSDSSDTPDTSSTFKKKNKILKNKYPINSTYTYSLEKKIPHKKIFNQIPTKNLKKKINKTTKTKTNCNDCEANTEMMNEIYNLLKT